MPNVGQQLPGAVPEAVKRGKTERDMESIDVVSKWSNAIDIY